jgi:predicted RNA-binding protein with RPS1 domain
MNTSDVGKTVLARVCRVEAYGVYLEFDETKTVLVLIPDVSDEPIFNLKLKFDPGQVAAVKILKFIEERGIYKGTMKGV